MVKCFEVVGEFKCLGDKTGIKHICFYEVRNRGEMRESSLSNESADLKKKED